MEKTMKVEVYAPTRKAWREWLRKYGEKEESAWLIIFKKGSKTPSVNYVEAVEEALCFGWIDSKANKRDEECYLQSFARRKPRSNWSKINKERVARLIATKKMTRKGLAVIELARKNGTWDALNDISELKMPADLKRALAANKKAQSYFMAFPPSTRKAIMEWILNAKTDATRDKRIAETVRLASTNIRANQYRPKGDNQ